MPAPWLIIQTVKIIEEHISLNELKQMAAGIFGNLVKAVVDAEKELLAVDSELHSDLEALLLSSGSQQINLWGINLYPDMTGDDFIEFDSLVNIRPSQGNMSRGVEDGNLRKKIIGIVAKRIKR